jgi:hypothetical protein
MFVYLQHESNKPVRIEVRDKQKFEEHRAKGHVWMNGKQYQIIEEDLSQVVTMWEPPKVEPASGVTWDEMRARVKHFKMYKEWPT